MRDLQLLVITGRPYLVTWMPQWFTTKILVKAWLVEGLDLAYIPKEGVEVTIYLEYTEAQPLKRFGYRAETGAERTFLDEWPRPPTWSCYFAIPVPTRPNTSLRYRVLKWLRLDGIVGQREVERHTIVMGKDGWSYVKSILLSLKDIPWEARHGS